MVVESYVSFVVVSKESVVVASSFGVNCLTLAADEAAAKSSRSARILRTVALRTGQDR